MKCQPTGYNIVYHSPVRAVMFVTVYCYYQLRGVCFRVNFQFQFSQLLFYYFVFFIRFSLLHCFCNTSGGTALLHSSIDIVSEIFLLEFAPSIGARLVILNTIIFALDAAHEIITLWMVIIRGELNEFWLFCHY